MKPRPITPTDLDYFVGLQPEVHTFTAPGEREAGVEPCQALVTCDPDMFERGPVIVRVPWTLNEIELVHLAKGGTLWLSCWGHLPVHALDVQPPEANR